MNKKNIIISLLLIYTFLNGFVFFEPALVDYFSIILIFYFIIVSFNSKIIYLLVYLFLIIASLFPFSYNFMFNNISNIRFFIIDIFLFSTFFSILSLVHQYSIDIEELMPAWTSAALINIGSYFIALLLKRNTIFNAEVIQFGIRLTGFFKDPNVCGPFIGVPTVYYFYKLMKRITIKNFSLFMVLFVGVILSFSRAAWLNLFIGMVIIFMMANVKLTKKFKYSIAIISAFVIFITMFNIEGQNIISFIFQRLRLQAYDAERFESQASFVKMIYINPVFGVGPGNYDSYSGIAAHQTYVRLIGEKGIFLGLAVSIFLLIPIFLSIKKKDILLFSIITGLSVNALFVDTLHWRFLFLIIALIIGGKRRKNVLH